MPMLFCFIPVVAHAQTQTNCTTFLGNTSCTTRDSGSASNTGVLDQGAILSSGAASIRNFEEEDRQRELLDAQNRLNNARAASFESQAAMQTAAEASAKRRIKFGKMIANGQCQKAFMEALETGELEVAREIKGLCELQK